MKRCPQCEFIYEDDQNLCDMDGIALVFDARPLPRLQAVTDPATDFVPGANWRIHILPVVAAAILGTVLFLVYFVSTHPLASRGADITPGSSTTVPQSIPGGAPGPTTPVAPVENASVPNEKKEDVKNESTDPKVGSPNVAPKDGSETQPAKVEPESSKKPVEKAKATNSVPRSGSAPRRDSQKTDSKITSFFKKTGNVLKKPFSH